MMTETEWLAAEFWPPMLDHVRDSISTRKSLLLGVALCRRIWDRLPFDDCREMVLAVERLADHPEVEGDNVPSRVYSEINDLFEGLQVGGRRIDGVDVHTRGAYLAAAVCGGLFHNPQWDLDAMADAAGMAAAGDVEGPAWEAERQAQARLLKELFGNPFRPVAFAPSWRSETAVALASAIYAERGFDRLPVLADALEEVGCDHPDVLAHCRGPGPHVRGCWVVDLVLGKS